MTERKWLVTPRHVAHLLDEVDYLRTLIKPHDTGHIITTIKVLHDRIKQTLEEMDDGTNK
jgi:hypothetical protein